MIGGGTVKFHECSASNDALVSMRDIREIKPAIIPKIG